MSPNWALTADDIVSMPVDELALEILRDFEAGGGWNSYNWINGAEAALGRGNKAALECLAGLGVAEVEGSSGEGPPNRAPTQSSSRASGTRRSQTGWSPFVPKSVSA